MPDDTNNQTPVCLASVDDLIHELGRRANVDLGMRDKVPSANFGENDAKPVHVEEGRDLKEGERDTRGVMIVVLVSPKMPANAKAGIDEENRQVMVAMAGESKQVLMALQYAADRYVAGIISRGGGIPGMEGSSDE